MVWKNKTVFVDVDDTFVRSYGEKRIPIPHVLKYIEEIHQAGARLFCWSSGGANYAKQSAEEFGIDFLFIDFLPKPDVIIDDVAIEDWRYLKQIHPSSCQNNEGF